MSEEFDRRGRDWHNRRLHGRQRAGLPGSISLLRPRVRSWPGRSRSGEASPRRTAASGDRPGAREFDNGAGCGRRSRGGVDRGRTHRAVSRRRPGLGGRSTAGCERRASAPCADRGAAAAPAGARCDCDARSGGRDLAPQLTFAGERVRNALAAVVEAEDAIERLSAAYDDARVVGRADRAGVAAVGADDVQGFCGVRASAQPASPA